MFIGTETTPNPNSMKFLPQKEVLPERLGTGMVIMMLTAIFVALIVYQICCVVFPTER
jgi:hypothetical protein